MPRLIGVLTAALVLAKALRDAREIVLLREEFQTAVAAHNHWRGRALELRGDIEYDGSVWSIRWDPADPVQRGPWSTT